MRRGFALVMLLALGLAACTEEPSGPEAGRQTLAPVYASAGNGIKDSYIVVLEEGTNARAVAAIAGVNPRYVYSAALNGFAAELNAGQLNALRQRADVAFIEADAEMTVTTTQDNATWGLDRVDQRSRPLNTTFNYTSTGAGVRAYVIDTGINLGHSEFVGRAVSGYDAIDGGSADDCNGHGTHVAGTVGGTVYGVAKGVQLVGVRVLNCAGSGTTSGVIAGVDWVRMNAIKPAVANMSLGGGASSALDAAVRNAINSGISFAVAAGNGNILGWQANACNYSPARVAEAITIGATDINDRKARWSNYGNCVDFFAPGVSITSAWYTSSTATNTISGTSMAAPHAAGVAAQYLQLNPLASPQQVRDALYANTTKGIVTSSSTANNHLLYSNY